MRIRNILLSIAAVAALSGCCGKAENSGRWSEEKANAWWAAQEWPVGCNYVPSYAINQFEFWQPETFNPEIIDRELGYAESIGFNTLRIYLHEMLWYADKDGFKSRINQFMDMAEKHGQKLIITFFTNGGTFNNPKLGPQPQPVKGVHGSGWIQSPGAQNVNNPESWPRLKEYVQDILRTYKDCNRVLYWCLYNEPENPKEGAYSLPLLKEVFKWAWEVSPSQPCSAPIWIRPGSAGTRTKLEMVSWICENVDIITFHCYYDKELETFIKMLKPFNRPMVCQEYMGRPRSTFEYSLPILKKEKIGAINWGLTTGKCGFYMPWGSKPGDPMPEVWFHDIFTEDGVPYSQSEIDFIKSLTLNK